MRTSHGPVRLVLMVSLCVVTLALSVGLEWVSADVGWIGGPRVAAPPARPLYPPPGQTTMAADGAAARGR